ncbi:MAG: alanyl-tRNA editing protein, partial [Rhizobiaceae bacterium]
MIVRTEALFRDDAYLSIAEGVVSGLTPEGGIRLDRTNFYAQSGGQPGDTGFFERADGSRIAIAATVTGETKDDILHIPAPGAPVPDIGEVLVLHIDWERRYKLMRMHAACHILSVVCPFPITGAAVGEDESRVDFDIPDPSYTRERVSADMMALVA